MFFGGTNFGFYNGANAGTDNSDLLNLMPVITSYDYDVACAFIILT